MDNLLYSVNAVAPVFLMVLFGYILKAKKIINDNFISVSQKFVFMLALPALIFRDIAKTDMKAIISVKLIAFSVIGTLVVFLAACVLACGFIKNRQSRGAFIQGIFRSNYAIMGIPLILNLFGQSGVAKGAIVLSAMMPVYNILAVAILNITAPTSTGSDFRKIIISILKNPLILATAAAIPFSWFGIDMPLVASRTIDYLSGMSTPLALIGIGGSIVLTDVRKKLNMSLSAAVIKLVVVPLIFVPLGYFMGLRGDDLGVIFILFASPTAVTSFIMAKAMNSDSELAAHIVLLTTLGSVLTLFFGIYILRTAGAI